MRQEAVETLFAWCAWTVILTLALGGRPWIFPDGARRIFAPGAGAGTDQNSAGTYGLRERDPISSEAVPGPRSVTSSLPRR